MKKITFLAIFVMLAVGASAQRISALTVEGIPYSVPFAAFNPTNNSETTLGDGQMVFPAGTDLSNVTVSLNVGTDSQVEAPVPLPTNWSSTVTGIKVTKIDLSSWAKYNITLKTIKPASLPLEIKTGAGNFDSNSWTKETVGWAAACIDKSQTLIRFGSANRSFMLAFTDAPDSLIYTIKFLAATWDVNNIFDVDGSADGITWTSIKQYNATVAMPISSPAVITRLKIAPEYRYIRWIYTKRASTNVSLENIMVTKDTTTGTLLPEVHKVKLYTSGDQLQIVNAEEISRLKVYSIAGSQVMDVVNPSSETNIQSLNRGMYIAELRLKNNVVYSARFMK